MKMKYGNSKKGGSEYPCSPDIAKGSTKGVKANYASTSFAKTPTVTKGSAKPWSGGGGPAGKAG